MTKPHVPSFAILRVEPRRAHEIPKVAGHNGRTIPVPNSDPSVPDGCELLRCDGEGDWVFHGVLKRIDEAGVASFSDKRHVAFEAVLTFSADADPMPSADELFERGREFCDGEWGRANVVALWGHRDEKTPHLHALVVPICQGLPPGRPRNGTLPQPRPVLSWNRFSGSYLRDYRAEGSNRSRPVDGEGKVPPKTKRNETMAGWQTKWASKWADFGLRRGIPSNRRHLTAKWVQGKIKDINAAAFLAGEALADVRSWFKYSRDDSMTFQAEPRLETLSNIIMKYLKPAMETHIVPLAELAKRGIQLESERQARADLADEYTKLESECAALRVEKEQAASHIELLQGKNTALARELMVAQWNSLRPPRHKLIADCAAMSDEQFDQLVHDRRRAREGVAADSWPMSMRPPLPVPQSFKQLSGSEPEL